MGTDVSDELVARARAAAADPAASAAADELVVRFRRIGEERLSDRLPAAAAAVHDGSPYGRALALGTALRPAGDAGQRAGAACVVAAVVTACEHWPAAPRVGMATAAGLAVTAALADRLGAAHAARWDADGTCGVVGAAAGCAVALGLDDDRLAAAVALATSQVSGHGVHRGTDSGELVTGRAAANGLLAAVLAAGGVTASRTALDGPDGLLAALAAA